MNFSYKAKPQWGSIMFPEQHAYFICCNSQYKNVYHNWTAIMQISSQSSSKQAIYDHVVNISPHIIKENLGYCIEQIGIEIAWRIEADRVIMDSLGEYHMYSLERNQHLQHLDFLYSIQSLLINSYNFC